ncbi:MAG: hypothetical protein ACRDMH_01240 [Solirubrobacterales bacterium]
MRLRWYVLAAGTALVALSLAGSSQAFIIDHHCGAFLNTHFCTTIAKQDGRVKFRLKQPRRSSRVYQLCFRNQDRSSVADCKSRRPFEKRGRWFVGVVDLKRDVPGLLKHPGRYSVRWWQHGHVLRPPLHFRLPPHLRPGPPIPDAYS